jgi:16S rRNA (adenine1518-N6/adenine1519-N6)-dimethyltransferase
VTRTDATRQQKSGIHYKHDLGQHFIYDTSLLRGLVEKAGVTKDDRVLEIGSGTGTLTVCLCEAAQRVVAVEVDDAVLPFLRLATQSFSNVEILRGDIRRMDLRAISASLGEGWMVVANIPYNITTPILELFLGSGLPVKKMAVMVQKEVADKLLAQPGNPAYGLSSVRCRYYCEPERIALVPAAAFTPPPKVDSAFISLTFRREPPLPVHDEALMWRIIRAGFNQRRKTLLNALKGTDGFMPDAARAAVEKLGLTPTVRGEALDVETWIALANELS